MSNDPATGSAAGTRDQAPRMLNIRDAHLAQANRCMALEEEVKEARRARDSKEEVLEELAKREYAHQVAAQKAHDLRMVSQRDNERLRGENEAMKAEIDTLRLMIKPRNSSINSESVEKLWNS